MYSISARRTAPPTCSPLIPPALLAYLPAALAAGVVFAVALYQGLATKNPRDFFIFRLGAQFVLRGENPYDLQAFQQQVAAAYPEGDASTREFVTNCGYFLPPQTLVVFLPLAAVPAPLAAVGWAVALGAAAFCVARLPDRLRQDGSPPLGFLARYVAPLVLVLNPLTLVVVVLGQMTLLSAGCVAAGLWCIERRRPYLAAVLWVLPFMKPHVALPLLPLLWYLAGWRPAVLLLVLVAAMNLLGATLVGGSPLFLVDYVDALSAAHKTVMYNRVESNPRIVSWNGLLYAAGGPIVEQTVVTTLTGYLIWFGLAVARVAVAGVRPPTAWIVAVAAVGSVFCPQVLVYELFLLVLLAPWLRDLFASVVVSLRETTPHAERADYTEQFASGHRFVGWLAIVLLAEQLIPPQVMIRLGFNIPPSLGIALLAALVLVGPWGEKTKGVEPS